MSKNHSLTGHVSNPQSQSYLPFYKRTGDLVYSLMNDYLFKLLMQENEEVLRGFLCALLSLSPEDIISIEIKNSILVNKGNWKDRSVIYLCRNFDKLSRGQDYIEATPTHHIGILDFSLPDVDPEFYSHYYLINVKTGKIYNDKFRLSVLDLNKIHLATQEDIDSGLQYWARFFKAKTWEDLKMLAKENPVFESASNTYTDLINETSIQLSIQKREEELAYTKRLVEKVAEQEDTISEQADTISQQADKIKHLEEQLAAYTKNNS